MTLSHVQTGEASAPNIVRFVPAFQCIVVMLRKYSTRLKLSREPGSMSPACHSQRYSVVPCGLTCQRFVWFIGLKRRLFHYFLFYVIFQACLDLLNFFFVEVKI